MASPGNQHCANCIGTLSFAVVGGQTFGRGKIEHVAEVGGRRGWPVVDDQLRTVGLSVSKLVEMVVAVGLGRLVRRHVDAVVLDAT